MKNLSEEQAKMRERNLTQYRRRRDGVRRGKKLDRVKCPSCGRTVSITSLGFIFHHQLPGEFFPKTCMASSRKYDNLVSLCKHSQ